MFSFSNRKRQKEVERIVRRIVDLTAPNLVPVEGESRSAARDNRTLPVLLTPWRGRSLVLEESVFGLTSNLSDRGVAVMLTKPLASQELAVTFWLSAREGAEPRPMTIKGHGRNSTSIGGGFWRLGIELIEPVESRVVVNQVTELASKLLPA